METTLKILEQPRLNESFTRLETKDNKEQHESEKKSCC